jgi:hypothetical protein
VTQYVYVLKKYSGGVLEIVGNVVQPNSTPVLNFLDHFADKAGATSDELLSLKDVGGDRRMKGRLIPASKITQEALCGALDSVSAAHAALVECFTILAEQPGALFQKMPSGKTNWHIVREFFALRILFEQARVKRSFLIAICHD